MTIKKFISMVCIASGFMLFVWFVAMGITEGNINFSEWSIINYAGLIIFTIFDLSAAYLLVMYEEKENNKL